jgi:hypothetical protein
MAPVGIDLGPHDVVVLARGESVGNPRNLHRATAIEGVILERDLL